MRVERVKLSKIKANPDNPRVIKNDQFKRLVKSLRDFPEMLEIREIVVDENYMVLGGNMRLKALQDIGEKEVYIKVAEGLTPEQKREFVIKDNSGFGDWDMDLLANEWGDLPLSDWGLDIKTFLQEIDEIDFSNQKNKDDDVSRIIIFCPDNMLSDVRAEVEGLKEKFSGIVFKVVEGF